MPIEYTNQPIRLNITAKLEFEDGQVFDFQTETTDFSEDSDTIASYFNQICTDVYEKLDEVCIEHDEDDYDIPHNDDFEGYTED